MSAVSVEPVAVSTEPKDLYRLFLLRRSGSEFLVASELPHFTLPCVEISQWERVAENVITTVRTRYGISVVCLFTPELSANTTGEDRPLYHVVETTEAGIAAPDGARWLPLNLLSDRWFADGQDFVAIANALRQMADFHSERVVGPFANPGWIEDLFGWVQQAIAAYRLRLTGEFRQLNAGPTFALLRLETNGPAIWFKAVDKPNLQEFPISVALSRLFPGFTPTVIASHPVWHGWLTMEFAGSTLDERSDVSDWELAAQTLAELQVESVGKSDQLLDAGCRDLRVSSLMPMVDPFIEVMSQLLQREPKGAPPVLNGDELLILATQIKEALSELAALDIPDALGHMDLNPGNIVCSAGHCVLLDWAEGCVGPPFLTFEYLRVHLARLRPEEEAGLATDIFKAYETPWSEILSPRTIEAAMHIAPVLAVFTYAVGSQAWRNPTLLQESNIAGYFRGLTRRMQREMQRLQDRRRPCQK